MQWLQNCFGQILQIFILSFIDWQFVTYS